MPGALDPVTIKDPTRYGALTMGGEQFTGLWTQRSPYRDAATAYLIKKFYQGSRFDSIWDGINREITVALTDKRRPGSSVWSAQAVPKALSFYSFKYVQNGAEVVRVLEDTPSTVLDVTAGTTPATLLTKAAGAGPARFVTVGTELFIGDGKEQKKILRSPLIWQASTSFNAGNFIIDPNGWVQEVTQPTASLTITDISVFVSGFQTYATLTLSGAFPFAYPVDVTLAGLTTRPALNGDVTITLSEFGSTITIPAPGVAVTSGTVAETGTVSFQTASGVSGGTAPSWNATPGGTTTDGTLVWQNMNTPLENWQIAPPGFAPTVTPGANNVFWLSNSTFAAYTAIIDTNNVVQVTFGGGTTGPIPPIWRPPGNATVDGTVTWVAMDTPIAWPKNTLLSSLSIGDLIVLDSNGNLQWPTSIGTTGGTVPAWATTRGASTTDNTVTWVCCGPGVQIATAPYEWSYSYHGVDGSVTTAAPTTSIASGILANSLGLDVIVTGPGTNDPQCDQIWIWRTAQGQSTLILSGIIPNPSAGTSAATAWSYTDTVPDTSTSGGPALNALIPAPVALSANPPPAGFTGMCWYLQRVWGFVGNNVYCSGGPDTLTGNGATAFPPLNVIPFLGAVIKLRPITVQNGALLVYTTSGIWIILGTGGQTNPFYDTLYCDKVNLANYNAEDMLGSELFLMEGNGRVASLTVEYPFNPQSGYVEIGLPIGDQFLKVTTGEISSTLYNPATTYLSWCVANTRDVGMYVADGGIGWFRLGVISPPESGLVWSPRAAIQGGTSAVQSVETSPGVYQLLIGPPTAGGYILARDTTGTVWIDNAVAYPSWDAKGVTQLCSTGQTADVAWIATKSAATGERPAIGVLMGEIYPTENTPYTILQPTMQDPADQPPSQTAFCDRYSTQQGAAVTKSDCILVKFDYGQQAFGDELLEFAIYGAKEEERKAAQ